jgi:hypothetical protein
LWFTSSDSTPTAGNTISFTQALTLNTNGALVLQGGNTSASGVGITFPATQSASSDANTLDDYEEGTWTPTWIGSTTNPTVTYNTQVGNYTKIGRMVYFDIRLVTTGSTGGTGNLEIGNLPFATLNSTGNPGFGLVSFSYGWAGNAVLATGVGSSVTSLPTYTQYAGNPGNTQVPANALAGATVYFTCSGWYIAA